VRHPGPIGTFQARFSQRNRNRAEVDFTPLSSFFLLIF
jgi:hypothetical protein